MSVKMTVKRKRLMAILNALKSPPVRLAQTGLDKKIQNARFEKAMGTLKAIDPADVWNDIV